MNIKPLWSEGVPRDDYPKLTESIDTEVLVIGGGITGLTSAYLIARSGFKVTLVERDRIGCGDTAHTTAHLTYMTDARLTDLVRLCGEEKALLAWMAGRQAMERIRMIAAALDTDVELREVPGYLVAADSQELEKETERLLQEEKIAAEMGFPIKYLNNVAPTGMPGLLFPGQMTFHPLKYLHAMARAASQQGVRIHELTDVSEFPSTPRHVVANGYSITYNQVIIATHVPLQGNSGTMAAAFFQTKLASYSTYAVAGTTTNGILSEMIWSDTAEPFHYLRVNKIPEGVRIVWGGEDHKTGQVVDTSERFEQLEQALANIAPASRISHRWSGQVVETVDGLPYIGETEDGQFIATGFSGNGMTFGTVAAIMARDYVSGKRNEYDEVFSPSRVEMAAVGNYLRENKDFPYLLIKDRLGIGKGDVNALEPGEGRVLKLDGERVAACRDDLGKLHQLCAVCPHLGCIVAWNNSEGTWDCPCHGSRFQADGKLIAGPAEEDLKSIAGK